jgi:hypothetical protein
MGVMYGRDDATWSQLTEAGQTFLIERARLRRTTSYTELNTALERRTGLPGFDFAHANERAAMGHLLYLIVMRHWPQTRLMLSALVLYLNGNDPGTGFYALAQELEVLPPRLSAGRKRKSSGSTISGTCTSTIPAPVDSIMTSGLGRTRRTVSVSG